MPALGRQADHRGGADDRHARRVCRLAGHARDRRLRSADLRDPRLSGRDGPGAAARHERLRRLEAAAADAHRAPASSRSPRASSTGCGTTASPLAAGRSACRCWPSPLLSATFSNAVIRDLRVDVVDQDQTADVAALRPGRQRRARASSVDAAVGRPERRHACGAVRRGDRARSTSRADFERDIVAGRRPQIVDLLQQAVLHARQHRRRARSTSAVSAATADLPPRARRIALSAPGPLVVEQYVLTNPALNYAQFLLRAILPMVLHVVIAIAARIRGRLGVRPPRSMRGLAGRRPAAVR